MTFATLNKVSSAILAYGSFAAVAVAQVQSELGASGGNPEMQQSKLLRGVALTIAAAHVGEHVTIPQIQQAALAVELTVGIAKALGLFGKSSASLTAISVPK